MKKRRLHVTVTAMAAVALLVAATLGYAVWFAYHSAHVADASLSSANKVSSDVPKISPVTDFAACVKAPKSVMLQTYPEQCVTAAGKKFTDTAQVKYLAVAEWGVKIPLADADKLTYRLTGAQSLSLYLKPSVTPLSSCQNLGVGYVRDARPGDYAYDLEGKQTVSGHTYVLTGSPGTCIDGDGSSGPTNQLRQQIVQHELPAAKIESAN